MTFSGHGDRALSVAQFVKNLAEFAFSSLRREANLDRYIP
jgi:hypothetical protein